MSPFSVMRCAVAVTAIVLSGCAIVTEAPPVHPNLVAHGARDSTFTLFVHPDGELCSSFGVRGVCVLGISDQLGRGVRAVLSATMRPADGENADFAAEFRPVALVMDRNDWTNRVRPRFKWQIVVRRRDGTVVVDVEETTIAPAPIPFDGDGHVALALVENIALERIRQIVFDAPLHA